MLKLRVLLLGCLLPAFYSSVVLAKPPVEVIAYQVESVSQPQVLQLLGHLQASQSVSLVASVTDRVHKLHFKEGQQVAKNQLLVELNNDEELALLEEIKVAVEESKKQYDRVKNIEGRGSVTAALIDEKYREWKKSIARQKVIEAQIADRKIFAPFAGLIGLTTVSEGALIQSGSHIVSIDNSQTMKLDLLVPIRYLSHIRPNLEVQIQTSALPERVFEGKITAISPRLDAETRMIQIRALIDNADLLLKTNMMVQAQIKLPERKMLRVPNSAVLMLGDHQFVYQLRPTEQGPYQAVKVAIKTGQIGPVFTEVLDGLKDQDLVVSQGIMRVNSQSQIQIKGFEEQATQAELLKPTSHSSQQKP